MALPATLVFEVQTGGADTNSGAFNAQGATPGTDRTQQTAAHVNIDGATITSTVHTTTSIINITGYTVSSADIRNTVRINGGTATAGLYEITAVDTVNNRWTLDRSAGTSTQTVIGKMGGCLASPALAAATVHNLGGWIWVKSGNYACSSSANVASGRVQLSGSGSQRSHIEGYQTTRGDRAARAVLQASANTYTLVTSGFNGGVYVCIEADANGHTGIQGFNGSADTYIDCVARASSTASGFLGGIMIRCHSYSASININSATMALFCYVEGGTTGFGSCTVCFGCVANGCGTAFTSTANASFINCVAYNPTTLGFGGGVNSTLFNSVIYVASGTLTTGYNLLRGSIIDTNAYGGTITTLNSNTNTFDATRNAISLSANPFVDPANKDFAINNTAGGGALLRAAGYPATVPWGATANSMDLGAYQVAGSGGGSSTIIILDDQ